MDRLVNLCGKAVRLEDIIGFAMDRKNYVYIPCFREITEVSTTRSLFGKERNSYVSRFEFYKHIPYGVVLGEKEVPCPGESYAYKTVGEIIGMDLFKSVKKAAGDAAHLAARALKIDTSINRKLRILVDGRDLKECRFDELPARLIYQDGRKVDVYKDSELYYQLGKNITPYEEPVPILEVQVSKNKKLIFFGDGIDVDNVNEPYQALLTAYNLLHAEKKEKKKLSTPKINLPRIGIDSIKLQSPFVIKRAGTKDSETVELEQPVQNKETPVE